MAKANNNDATKIVTIKSTELKAELRKRTYKEEACGKIAGQCLKKHHEY